MKLVYIDGCIINMDLVTNVTFVREQDTDVITLYFAFENSTDHLPHHLRFIGEQAHRVWQDLIEKAEENL